MSADHCPNRDPCGKHDREARRLYLACCASGYEFRTRGQRVGIKRPEGLTDEAWEQLLKTLRPHRDGFWCILKCDLAGDGGIREEAGEKQEVST